MSEPQKRFFQRAIVGWTTKVVKGVECIDRVRLSCGHWRAYKRVAPVGRVRKSAPCYDCGSSTRTPMERSRGEYRLRVVLAEAFSDPVRTEALFGFVQAALQIRTLHPTTERAEQLYEVLDTQARRAGLLGGTQEEELEELDVSQTSGRGRGGIPARDFSSASTAARGASPGRDRR